MSKKQFDREHYKEEILRDFEKGEFVSISNLDEEMRQAKQAASNFMKRDSRINIRVSHAF